MKVIGTAGHVDHGKSTLIEALTGMNPDRLKEERERQMTIDLGFAWMDLPSGEPVGIVDVPGHRDFIGNMLAGVGGIDAALFVIAVDEGVMPQTREHLAILDILQIEGGVIALTKIDLIEDEDWIDLVEEDVREVLRGTVLEDVPIVRVSSQDGRGIPDLREKFDNLLAKRPPRQDLRRPRLPVDRVFSIAGFGTVVTGTLRDGKLKVGDEVEILPRTLHGRIRGLQTHKQKENIAIPGSRTAINITGVSTDQIQRGDVVAHIGDYGSTRRLDVRFRLLPDASAVLKHNLEVKLFIGSAEVLARVRTLGKDRLSQGEEGWLQLETKEPVVAVRGDHYILRRPSPGETIGGGIVVDPNPKGRHKRFATGLIERLASLAEGTPADILIQSLATLGAAPMKEVAIHANLEESDAQMAIDELIRRNILVILEDEKGELLVHSDILVSNSSYWEQLTAETLYVVENYHIKHPLRSGMPKEELKSRLNVSPRLFSSLIRNLIRVESIREVGPLISSPDHEIKFSTHQEQAVSLMQDRFQSSPFSPPSIKDTKAELGEDVYSALVELDILVPVSAEVVFRREDYNRMVAELEDLFRSQGTLSAAQVRDHFNTSRRYVLALLEHLDEIGRTVREGDVRRLR
jgi:selenocysteine-specific elongation factor